MGYLVIAVMILVILGLVVAILTRASGKPPRGTVPTDKPVAVEKPSADEPTPGASSTASPNQAEHARKHTPPS